MSNIYLAKGNNIVKQYEDIGKIFADELQKTEMGDSRKILIAERMLKRVQTESVFEQFYQCFAAWARGGRISEQQAMYLLVDNLEGCQTMMVRYNGGVGMLHTEEEFNDVKARMRGPHTIEFNDNGRRLITLVYNNLMPGAALFGWQNGAMVAVDALFVSEVGVENIVRPMLANIIGWLIWYRKPSEYEPKKMVAELAAMGELVDGYAINVVYQAEVKIEAYKVSFTRNDWEIEMLGERIGANLRQTNLIEPSYITENKPLAKHNLPAHEIEYYHLFLERLEKMRMLVVEHQALLARRLYKNDVESIHKSLQENIFGEQRELFVNEDMGAAMVGIVDEQVGVSVSCKLNDGKPGRELEYLDF